MQMPVGRSCPKGALLPILSVFLFSRKIFSKKIDKYFILIKGFIMRKIGENIDYPTNDEVRFLIEIANLLNKKGKIRSFREFSRIYLDKNENYMNVLLYDLNIKPSIGSLITLYQKLREEGILPNILPYFQNHIFGRIASQYRRKDVLI